MIDWQILIDYYPYLLQGVLTTLVITLGAVGLGLILSPIIALIQLRGHRVFQFFATIYVTLIRGTPMLIQIISLFYILPGLGIELSALNTAILAIGCNSAAYISQTLKVGLLSVQGGQLQAAMMMGYSKWQVDFYILFPQAVRKILPSLGNEMITLIKDSSLASIIGVMELSKQGSFIRTRTYDPITVLFFVGLIYLVLTGLVSLLVSRLEKK